MELFNQQDKIYKITLSETHPSKDKSGRRWVHLLNKMKLRKLRESTRMKNLLTMPACLSIEFEGKLALSQILRWSSTIGCSKYVNIILGIFIAPFLKKYSI